MQSNYNYSLCTDCYSESPVLPNHTGPRVRAEPTAGQTARDHFSERRWLAQTCRASREVHSHVFHLVVRIFYFFYSFNQYPSSEFIQFKDLLRYPLARDGVYAAGGLVCLAHARQKVLNIVGLAALRLVFYGIWITQSGAMVFILNLDNISLKKLFPTMNI